MKVACVEFIQDGHGMTPGIVIWVFADSIFIFLFGVDGFLTFLRMIMGFLWL